MTNRYLTLALIASALWGVSYPITYLALRLYGVGQLLMLTYLFSVVLLMVALVVWGYDGRSILMGLLISPINYALSYLYIKVAEYMGGLTALISSGYVVPLIILDYFREGSVNIRHVVSALTLLGSLYLLFQGYADSVDLALLLMVLNLLYAIVLDRISDVDTLNLVFGQFIGTLLISLVMINRIPSIIYLSISYVYYPILLALVGNVIPYTLYAISIRMIGPTETSLTTSVEIASSIFASIPFQQLPTNPIAWILLITSILSTSVGTPMNIHRGLTLTSTYNENISEVFITKGQDIHNYLTGEIMPRHRLRSVIVMLGRRKVI